MNTNFEIDLIRNTSFGAVVLWRFVRSWHDQGRNYDSPPLIAVMLPLPMVCHEATVKAIATRNKDGALLKALAEDRTVALGLQPRIQAFADRTFRSLNLAIAAGLVGIDRSQGIRIIPTRAKAPFIFSTEADEAAISAADRLGHSISLTGLETSCSLLGVRF